MGKKKYTSARGAEINFDELTRANKNVIAMGNARMNARGDKLGPGGKVIETAEQMKARVLTTQDESGELAYNQANPKAVRMVSIKDSIDKLPENTTTARHPADFDESNLQTPAEAMANIGLPVIEEESQTPAEVMEELTKKSKKSENKRKIIDKED